MPLITAIQSHGDLMSVNKAFTRDGVAVMPDTEKVQELSGSDMAHWLKLKPEEKKLNTKPQPQKWCTQEERQEVFL